MRPLLAALLLSSLAAPVLAQDSGQSSSSGDDQQRPEPPAGSERPTIMAEPVAMLIATFDTDYDGKTTRAELAAGVARTFKAIDTAGVGHFGYIEYSDWATRFLGSQSALPSPYTVDGNADNTITLAEMQAAMSHIFDRLDADNDGVVTRAECLTIREAGDGFGGGGGGQHHGGGRRGGHGGGGHRGGGMGGGMGGGGGGTVGG